MINHIPLCFHFIGEATLFAGIEVHPDHGRHNPHQSIQHRPRAPWWLLSQARHWACRRRLSYLLLSDSVRLLISRRWIKCLWLEEKGLHVSLRKLLIIIWVGWERFSHVLLSLSHLLGRGGGGERLHGLCLWTKRGTFIFTKFIVHFMHRFRKD